MLRRVLINAYSTDLFFVFLYILKLLVRTNGRFINIYRIDYKTLLLIILVGDNMTYSNVLPVAERADGNRERASRARKEAREMLFRYLKQFPDEREGLTHAAKQLCAPGYSKDAFVRSNMEGHVTASMVVLSGFPDSDPQCRHLNENEISILVVHHKILELWIPPGGHYETPESLWETAQREVREETAIEGMQPHQCGISPSEPLATGLLMPIDIDTSYMPRNCLRNEGEHYHHDFRFLSVLKGPKPALHPQEEEVDAASWMLLRDYYQQGDRRARILRQKLRAISTTLSELSG